MNKQIAIIVIATCSIPLADGLAVLLTTSPLIEKVEIVRTIEKSLEGSLKILKAKTEANERK